MASDLSFAQRPVPPPRLCPVCASEVDITSRHVSVHGSAVRIYCSAECMRREGSADELVEAQPAAATRGWLRPVMGGTALLGVLLITDTRIPEPAPAPPVSAAVVALPDAPPAPPEPAPPIMEPDPEPEWVAEILRDVWLHPLAGPIRRMPRVDGAVFGAERPGERAPECKNGHCGVDIGGDVWGEPVLAAHDGFVDRVQRGPNEDHGGLYVRLAHRNGTVFTQYFHLAAIPRSLVVGKKVNAGDVIGLLGDSGVRNSGPHLHFTISVKPGPDLTERFVDPEPLIALWPLRIASHETGGPALSTEGAPGVVRGAAPKRHKSGRSRRERIKPALSPAEPAPPEDSAPEAPPTESGR